MLYLTPLSASLSSATTSPLSSLFSLIRSMFVAALLYGFCLGAINVSRTQRFNMKLGVLVCYFWSKLMWIVLNLNMMMMMDVCLFCFVFFYIRHHGGMLMCQYCSLCSVAYSWPYLTTSAAKAVTPPSCGEYFE